MRWFSRGLAGLAAMAMLLSLFVSGATVGAATADANQDYVAILQSANEVPPSDENAFGIAYFHIEGDGQTLDYNVFFWSITDPMMGHIHLGARGVNGPIVLPMFNAKTHPIQGNFSGTIVSGTATAADLTGPLQGKSMNDLFAAMKSGGAYTNFHTMKSPGGASRGQIVNADPSHSFYGVLG